MQSKFQPVGDYTNVQLRMGYTHPDGERPQEKASLVKEKRCAHSVHLIEVLSRSSLAAFETPVFAHTGPLAVTTRACEVSRRRWLPSLSAIRRYSARNSRSFFIALLWAEIFTLLQHLRPVF